MRSRFFTYSVIVALICSLGCWTALVQRATGGRGSGNSWHSWGAGPGYSGGGWATGGGGGHK